MISNPFSHQPEKFPSDKFLDAIAAGHTDKAAAGIAGWTIMVATTFVEANTRYYEIADNKRQHTYEEYLMATGRGADVARVALRQETRSWVQKAEPLPVKIIEGRGKKQQAADHPAVSRHGASGATARGGVFA